MKGRQGKKRERMAEQANVTKNRVRIYEQRLKILK
jgi:hypothetical protein